MTMYVCICESNTNNVCDQVSPEIESECFSAKNKYIWETAEETKPTVGIQFQVCLKRYIEYWEKVLKAPDHIIESIHDGYVLPLFSPRHHTWAAIINQR